VHKKLTNRI